MPQIQSNQIATNLEFTFSELALGNGSAANPAISFTADPDTGWYGLADNSMRLSLGGTQRFIFDASSIWSPDGTAAQPAYTFVSDSNTGLFRIGSDELGFSTAGSQRLAISTSTISPTLPFRAADGSASAPVYSFGTEGGLGWYRGGPARMSLAFGTVEGAFFDGATGVFGLKNNYNMQTNVGTVSTPGYSFDGDANTGIYHPSADTVSISTGGVERFRQDGNTSLYGALIMQTTGEPIRVQDGSASAPGIQFTNDTNTGIYRSAADQVAISCNAQGPHLLVDKTSLNIYASNDGSSVLRAQVAQEGLGMANNARIYNTLGTNLLPSYSFAGDTDTGLYSNTADTMRLVSGGNEKLVIEPTGVRMIAGNQFSAAAGSVASPSITFIGDTDTGFYSGGTNAIAISQGGTQTWQMTSAGGLRPVTYNTSFFDGGFGEAVTQNQSTSVDYGMGGDFVGFVMVQTYNNVNTAHGSKLFWVSSSATELSFTQLSAQGGQSGLITVTNPSGMTLRVALGATGSSGNKVMFMRSNISAG